MGKRLYNEIKKGLRYDDLLKGVIPLERKYRVQKGIILGKGKMPMKKVVGYMLMFFVLIVLGAEVDAKNASTYAYLKEDETITFKNVNNMNENESIEYTVKDKYGNPIVIGIESVSPKSRATDPRTWRVYARGVFTKCEFYMTVSNNKVTKAYDDEITTYFGVYEDAKLVLTNTVAKLTFKFVNSNESASSTCWLQGAVTGSDNDINVTWDL